LLINDVRRGCAAGCHIGKDIFADDRAHGGLSDGGTLELTGNYKFSDAGQAALIAQRGQQAAIVVTFSDSTTSTFNAIVGAYNLSNPLDDKVEFTCSLKVTGAITLA